MRTEQPSKNRSRHIFLTAIYVFVFGMADLSAQNLNVGFGKSRVQYHKQFDEWQYYETPHLTTYWYGDARNIAISALQMTEFDYDEIQQLLEYQLSDRIELLVFTDLTDLKQSNIGSEDLFLLKSGETKVTGNKMFVYYDGNHEHLHRSLREGVAGIMINAMLFGGNLQEIVQNSVLLNLPGWYTGGLKAYCGETWSVEKDEQLRNALASGKYTTFDKLAKAYPILAGHVFWHYIAQQFGPASISNLLYLTRINRGLDAGFRYVMGSGYDKTTEIIFSYYQKKYIEEEQNTDQPNPNNLIKIKNKRKLPLYEPCISPDGNRIAWVQNDLGKWKVWVKDLRTGKRKRLLKGGSRNALQATDQAYPLLTWASDNQTLGIVFEKRDVAKLALINTETRKKETKPISPEFQRVHSIDFINPIDMIFSATVRGYTDLYIYHTVNRQTERLTQDFWDDLDAAYAVIEGKRYILFTSNRISDTLAQERLDSVLPLGQRDVFLFDLDTRSNELLRMSNTPFANERKPIALDSTHFMWISTENGIQNRSVGHLEDYTAYYKTTFFLKNGVEVNALATDRKGEWPFEKILYLLAPVDTVRKNLDSTQIDSIRTVPVLKKKAVSSLHSNFASGILHLDANTGNHVKVLEGFRKGKETRFYLTDKETVFKPNQAIIYTSYMRQLLSTAGVVVPDSPLAEMPSTLQQPLPPNDSIPIGWLFQLPDYLAAPSPEASRTPDEEPEASEPEIKSVELQWNTRLLNKKNRYLSSAAKHAPIVRFNPSRIVPYRLKFRTDFVSTTMDNSLLFEGLDSYAGSPGGFRTPPPGVLLRANFKELLENYVVEAGFRLPVSFNGAEYYLWMENRKNRLDKRVNLYRKTILNTLDGGQPGGPSQPYQVRTNTLLGQYEIKYPIDPFLSFRATGTLRQDKKLTLTSDKITLETPDYAEQRAAIRLSAVYDNTVDIDINLKTGSRARFYVEAVKRFELNTQPNWSFRLNTGFMTVLNLDARHYQRLDKHSILALRVAAATSFGSEKILYYVGGVDNWIIPKFNESIPVPQNENFAYQTLAVHMRGFKQNIRNGSSFALLNSEVRIPVFKYFSKKPVMGSFWKNFQITGFFDAGSAWTGSSPYNGDNPINIVFIENPPTVKVKVNYFRDPLVAGYGAGLRMQVFGLFLRADYAWGIESRRVQKPMLYIALGADF
jgi:Tol biopolymer transport system component